MVELATLSALLLVSAAINVCLALLALNLKSVPLKRTFFFPTISVAILAIAFCIELNLTEFAQKSLLNDIEYVFITAIPLFFLFFVLEFTGRRKMISARNVALLFLVPMIVLIALWTNDYHHLFYSNEFIEDLGGYGEFTGTYGPFFWLFFSYSRLLLLTGTLLIFNLYLNTPRMHRRQAGLVFIATLIPWATTAVEFLPMSSLPITALNVLALTISITVFFKASLMSDALDMTPLALNMVIDHLDDGIMILDPGGKIAYLNNRAMRVLEKGEDIIGRKAEEALPDLMGIVYSLDQNGGKAEDIPLVLELGGKQFEVRVSLLTGQDGTVSGRLLTLRDITKEWSSNESQRMASEKVRHLYSVTSSDILNELATFKGYFELASPSWPEDSKKRGHFDKMANALVRIERGMVLTSDFQRIGTERPRWQSIETMVSRAGRKIPEDMLEIDAEEVEIFADPMLERVFLNLFENTLMHGGKASKIWIRTSHKGKDLMIEVADNGIGIPAEEKDTVFELDYGKYRGLGLFTSRHILSMTGCTITEDGIPGESCRFEIIVPDGKWRGGSAS